ncbi:MAG: hypothetical protein COA96_18265 [SAR86 cluster bacterium]|uniref:Response regulatory domain-containing protein n=1 Tax=SAR86 cluster bacterium TaxID=2030880 RepID=A0A2A5ABU5_9GAMM|nr:MAG: hypothetical protein COA96_18265 [SAR86 cluster bacterium]
MNAHASDTQMRKLLIIDDNEEITDILEEVARVAGYEVTCIHEFEDIGGTFQEFDPDLIFLDLDLGVDSDMDMSEKGYDGLAALQLLSERGCTAKIVLVSGMGQDKRQQTRDIGREMKLDVIGSIPKPFSIDSIDKLLLQLRGDT